MENSLVSVIIPTYNRSDYLKITLESVINQTYSNIEIIVVDDGSPTNDSAIICEAYNKVTYIKIENSGGPATPRNVGIKNATGDFIAFVDDDDIWLPHKIETQLKILENEPTFGLVHGPCQLIDGENNLQETIIGRPGSLDVKHGDVRERMMGNWTLMMPTPLLRKLVVEEVGFFNEDIPPALEDVEYWNRCAFHTKFYYFDEVLVYYRRHSANISGDQKKYMELPAYLMEVLIEKSECGLLDKQEYVKLLKFLCYNQIRLVKYGWIKTIIKLFQLDAFWYTNPIAVKLFLKRIL